MLFSLARVHSVKPPRRIMQLCTLYREVGSKWATSEQANFFDSGSDGFFCRKLSPVKQIDVRIACIIPGHCFEADGCNVLFYEAFSGRYSE